ncbi:hypothetical protein ROZALSC1DRAFT_25675 [Rozella allomycis CSF55]|uniref:Uncharacterized protein n=1 Tax=Rozella allomycis (strain CSF55) TaxID=988480 RepID=A0A4P9YBY1_ROZAC|nr:hypothetical protein ROZALSC1DRAFT_25675 [Rozella allomycis CSF55]
MRMVRSVKKRKLKDHCQLDNRNINQHMDYFKSTFGSAPMGNFVEEVNFDVEGDEIVDENENLLSDVVNLHDDNESILLGESSSNSSPNSININQSNANHGISNLPDSNLYSSSSSPSDLGEVMLIDLPCPSSISNSTSKSNFNHINNHALPYQVDAPSNVNHEISNLPASISPILCSSSLSSSDLGEVMLIDLPCPSSISNFNSNSNFNSYSDPYSNSTSNINLSKNQSLPCQVDALTCNEHLTSMSNSVLHPVSYLNSKLPMVDVSMNESLPCQNDTSRKESYLHLAYCQPTIVLIVQAILLQMIVLRIQDSFMIVFPLWLAENLSILAKHLEKIHFYLILVAQRARLSQWILLFLSTQQKSQKAPTLSILL